MAAYLIVGDAMATEITKQTNNAGQASVTYTAPATGGSAVVTAAVAGVATPTVFNIDVPGDVLSAVSPLTPQVAVSQTSTLTVKLVDKDGAAKANQAINFAITGSGAGSLSAASASTNASGEASVVYTAAAGGAGTSVTVEASGATVSPITFTIGVLATPKDVLSVPAGLAQSVVIGENLPITVRLVDAGSVAKSSVTINFALTGAGSLSAASAVTDASGNATVTYNSTGATVGGSASIVISGTNFDPATITISPLAAPKDVLTVTSGLTPSVVLGENIPVTVRLVNSASAAKSGVAINFALTGAGSLSAASANTDASGNAAITYNSTGAVADTQVTIAVNGDNFDPATITVSVTAAQVITMAQMLSAMADREYPTRERFPAYTSYIESSADGRSWNSSAPATIPLAGWFGDNAAAATPATAPRVHVNFDWNNFNADLPAAAAIGVIEPVTGQAGVNRYTYAYAEGPGVMNWLHYQGFQVLATQQNFRFQVFLDGEADKQISAAQDGTPAIDGSWYDFVGGEKFVPRPLSHHSGGFLLDYSLASSADWSIADTTRYDPVFDVAYPPERGGGSSWAQHEKAVQGKAHHFIFPIFFNEKILVQGLGTLNPFRGTNVTGAAESPSVDRVQNRMWWCLGYSKYEAGTTVETYTAAQRDTNEALIKSTADTLQSMTASGVDRTGGTDTSLAGVAIPVNGERAFVILGANKAITEIVLKFNTTNLKSLAQALRSSILTITFDEAATPQVECPVGDFFATGNVPSPAETWYLRVDFDGTMASYFVMPFATSAEVKIKNVGAEPITFETASLSNKNRTWDASKDRYFFAQWKEYNRLETLPRRFLDVVNIVGDGIYLGTTLNLYNATQHFQYTDQWPGEGEIHVLCDDENTSVTDPDNLTVKPRIFTSGTEEIHGFNLSRPHTFSDVRACQARGDGNNEGLGWMITTWWGMSHPIRFKSRCRSRQEWWAWDTTESYNYDAARNPQWPDQATVDAAQESRVNYAFVAYWYAKPGCTFSDIDGAADPTLQAATNPNGTRTRFFDEAKAKLEVALTKPMLYAAARNAIADPAVFPITGDLNPRPKAHDAAPRPSLTRDLNLATKDAAVFSVLTTTQAGSQLPAIDTGSREIDIWRNTVANGAELTYQFQVYVAGAYSIDLRTIKSPDSGNFNVSINGGASVKEIRLYNSAVSQETETIDSVDLTSGVNEITFTSNDKEAVSTNYYLILDGIDIAEPITTQRFTFLDLTGTYPVGYTGLTELTETQLSDASLITAGSRGGVGVAFWGNSTANDAQLSYTLNVSEAGNYQINLRAFKADDAGIFEVTIAGTTYSQFDFYISPNDPSTSPQTIDLGIYTLAGGNNGIIFTSKGRNPSNTKGYVLIPDYLEITPTTEAAAPPASVAPTAGSLTFFGVTSAPLPLVDGASATPALIGAADANTAVLAQIDNTFLQDRGTPASIIWRNTGETTGTLEYTFNVPVAGNYTLALVSGESTDFGNFTMSINDVTANDVTFDFYAAAYASRTYDLGQHSLTSGNNTIKLSSNTKNASASDPFAIITSVTWTPVV